MARFDVRRFGNAGITLVVEVQADVLEDLATRVVIPLLPAGMAAKGALTRLNPRIHVAGEDYVLMTTDIAALPARRLGSVVENIEAVHRDDITDALDFLLFGF